MPTHPYKLVCFDLGGVLVHHTSTWVEACKIAKVPLEDLFGGENDPALVEAAYKYDCGTIDDVGFGNIVRKRYPHAKDEQIVKVIDAWLLGPVPSVDKVLDSILLSGVQTSCLTNTNHRHWRAMTEDDPYIALDKLQYRFASHLLGLRKPDHAIFKHVEDTMGIPGTGIVYFDDRMENIKIARDRGWQARPIDPRRNTLQQVVQDLMRLGVLDKNPLDEAERAVKSPKHLPGKPGTMPPTGAGGPPSGISTNTPPPAKAPAPAARPPARPPREELQAPLDPFSSDEPGEG